MEPVSPKPTSTAAPEGARATPERHAPSGDDFAALFLNILFGRDHVTAWLAFSSCANGPRPSAQPVKASDSRCGDVSFPSNGNSLFARSAPPPRRAMLRASVATRSPIWD